MRLRLVNRGHRTLNLRIVGIAEWMMGANRADRGTTVSSAASQRAAPGEGNGAADAEPAGDERRMTTLFCTPARPRRPASAAAPPSSASPAMPKT